MANIEEVRNLVRRGAAAHRRLAGYSCAEIERIVAKMVEKGEEASEELARLAAGETGRGNLESTLTRHRFVLQNIMQRARDASAWGIVAHYPQRRLYEVAVPLGLIAAVVPFRAPTSTAMAKALLSVYTRNCVVFAPPAGAVRCVQETVRVLEAAAEKAGAPEGCLSCLKEGDEQSLSELMRQREISFILATANDQVVTEANRTGKPNISVGDSNTPAYIDRSAGIAHAVRCILSSQQFDFAMGYGAEEFILIHAGVYPEVLAEFKKQGAVSISDEEAEKLSVLLAEGACKIAGLSAHQIARMARFTVPPETPALIIAMEKVAASPLCRPKMAPLLPMMRVRDWEEACAQCLAILKIAGAGHSVVVHATDLDIIMEFVEQMPVARILVNSPGTQAAMGLSTGLTPSLTPGTGTNGASITTDNVSVVHFFQRKRVTTIHEDSALWEPGLPDLNLDGVLPSSPVASPKPSPWIVSAPPLPSLSPKPVAERPQVRPSPWSISAPPLPPPAKQPWPRKK